MTITRERKDKLRCLVQHALASSMENYPFSQLIDEMGSDVSDEETKWAKKNLNWVIIRTDLLPK